MNICAFFLTLSPKTLQGLTLVPSWTPHPNSCIARKISPESLILTLYMLRMWALAKKFASFPFILLDFSQKELYCRIKGNFMDF